MSHCLADVIGIGLCAVKICFCMACRRHYTNLCHDYVIAIFCFISAVCHRRPEVPTFRRAK